MNKFITGFVGPFVAALLINQGAVAETILPNDPQKSECSISESEFGSWIAQDSKGPLPLINPADSVQFPPIENTKCDFYKWSAQMFLWATSPAEGYGGEGVVFDSPIFFNVAPEVGGTRSLIPNGGPQNFAVRSVKSDEEIGETGQAGGGGALISQRGSLVYYGIHVNNVYAYFAKITSEGGFNSPSDKKANPNQFPNAFPTLEKDLKELNSHIPGGEIRDGKALAMELKTSWVEANFVENPEQYVIINAVVPNYEAVSENRWTLVKGNPTKEVHLAMVGMHVVGTVQGHPEMVWATYEHINNAPDVGYIYKDTSGKINAYGGNYDKDWQFSQKGSDPYADNTLRAENCPSKKPIYGCVAGDIVSPPGQTIGASNTSRLNPWGNIGAASIAKNADSAGIADNNAQIISLNNDIRKHLSDRDFRQFYILQGAVWTQKGGIPNYTKMSATTQIGSLSLANTTMETYHQLPFSNGTVGCFSCHSIGNKNPGTDVSHIFDAIVKSKPMYPKELKN